MTGPLSTAAGTWRPKAAALWEGRACRDRTHGGRGKRVPPARPVGPSRNVPAPPSARGVRRRHHRGQTGPSPLYASRFSRIPIFTHPDFHASRFSGTSVFRSRSSFSYALKSHVDHGRISEGMARNKPRRERKRSLPCCRAAAEWGLVRPNGVEGGMAGRDFVRTVISYSSTGNPPVRRPRTTGLRCGRNLPAQEKPSRKNRSGARRRGEGRDWATAATSCGPPASVASGRAALPRGRRFLTHLILILVMRIMLVCLSWLSG